MEGAKKLTVEAVSDNLDQVTAFVQGALEEAGFPKKPGQQLLVAVEEIFINITRYAYQGAARPGEARLALEVTGPPLMARLLFEDDGAPFNPLANLEPDTTLPASQRAPGGLGILMAKRMTDAADYRREAGRNIFTLTKNGTGFE